MIRLLIICEAGTITRLLHLGSVYNVYSVYSVYSYHSSAYGLSSSTKVASDDLLLSEVERKFVCEL